MSKIVGWVVYTALQLLLETAVLFFLVNIVHVHWASAVPRISVPVAFLVTLLLGSYVKLLMSSPEETVEGVRRGAQLHKSSER